MRQCDFVMDSVSWDSDLERVGLSGEEMQEFIADRNRVSVGSGPGKLVTCCHLQVLCGTASHIPVTACCDHNMFMWSLGSLHSLLSLLLPV